MLQRKYIVIGILILTIGYFLGRSLIRQSGSNQIGKIEGVETELAQPLAKKSISQGFSFPLKSGNDTIGNMNYTIESVELQKEIVIKGQKGRAVPGRAFLVANLKLANDSNQPVKLNSRDYIRLTVQGEQEQRAPDIHNDPIEVQAISTKYTRVGFPVDENLKSFTLRIGEITGQKVPIEVSF